MCMIYQPLDVALEKMTSGSGQMRSYEGQGVAEIGAPAKCSRRKFGGFSVLQKEGKKRAEDEYYSKQGFK